jgi:hypothetical protein
MIHLGVGKLDESNALIAVPVFFITGTDGET